MDSSRPEGFARRSVPRALGSKARGAMIAGGTLTLRGGRIDGAPFASRDGLSDPAMAELHGFGWLDDLAADGSPAARDLAQAALLDWLRAEPQGASADSLAWAPAVVGRRLSRWVFHAGILLPGLDRAAAAPFFDRLRDQITWLTDHAGEATGPARIEALAGLAIAAMNLRGVVHYATPALTALSDAASTTLGSHASPARNPEALLDLTAMLVWTLEEAADARMPVPPEISRIARRCAVTLAALRHADGSLPRAHGGSSGAPGRLDAVLAACDARQAKDELVNDELVKDGLAMGFAMLQGGRATLSLDAAPPPARTPDAHAGTLGFELTIDGQPLITACGDGARHGPDWTTASRASAAHSTLVLDGLSSSWIRADGSLDPMPDCPPHPGTQAGHLTASHAGWRDSHGVEHHRTLRLDGDGNGLHGTDALMITADATAQTRLAASRDGQHAEVTLHFHLHPAIRAVSRSDGAALRLPSGEVWQFRHDPRAVAKVAPSVHLDPASPDPAPAHQIVLRTSLADACARPLDWLIVRA